MVDASHPSPREHDLPGDGRLLATVTGVYTFYATFNQSPRTERALEHTPLDPQTGKELDHADSTHASSADGMFVALYEELRVLAERQLRRGGRELSLSATTLLHEAYIALGHSEARFPDRARFMGYVARAMRGLIIDYARRSRAVKRGGGAFEITLHPDAAPNIALVDATELEGLGDALDELATVQPALAELVDLHFFAGLTFGEIATLRGVSERTAQRDWRKARLILHRNLMGVGF